MENSKGISLVVIDGTSFTLERSLPAYGYPISVVTSPECFHRLSVDNKHVYRKATAIAAYKIQNIRLMTTPSLNNTYAKDIQVMVFTSLKST